MNITLEAVDRQIGDGFLFLNFEPAIESKYKADVWPARKKHLVITSLIAIVLYNSFLISDWQMLPDVFMQAVVCRALIFTPVALLALWSFSRTRAIVACEVIASVAPVFSMLMIAVFFVQSASPFRPVYNHGIVLIMLFASNVQRLRFRYAVPSNIAVLIVEFISMSLSGVFSSKTTGSDVIFFGSAMVLMLAGNYAMERESRLSYLLALRGHLLNEQLDHSAKIDPLTGLWNRRHLSEHMERAWAAAGSSVTMGVILMDLDHFKLFNDSYGHLEGDVCLQRAGRCLNEALEDSQGIAVRFGGEEFLIFAPDTGLAGTLALAARLRAAMHRAAIGHPALGARAIVTASYGVAADFSTMISPCALIAAADKALYRAKDEGRDCIRAQMPLEQIAA